jgi:hypothetical protein
MNEGALANLDHDAALREIANGTIARTIAERYNCTPDAVRKALQRARPDEYKQAVAQQVEHWVFDSAEEMNNLPADAVCIARARARADFRLKLAAKLNPAYADKQEVTHEIGESFASLLEQVSKRRSAANTQIIDVTPEQKQVSD